MTDNTNTTKAQKTDIEGLLGADKVKPFYKRGGFWLVLLVFLGILFVVYYFFLLIFPIHDTMFREAPWGYAV